MPEKFGFFEADDVWMPQSLDVATEPATRCSMAKRQQEWLARQGKWSALSLELPMVRRLWTHKPFGSNAPERAIHHVLPPPTSRRRHQRTRTGTASPVRDSL
jgi:hypothetical protein